MVKTQKKSRQRIAAERMTKVKMLQQRLSSGAVKSDLRSVSEGIHAARALYKQIEVSGMPAKDFWVHIAYLTPDLSVLSTQPFEPGKEAAIQAELSGQGMFCIVVGLVFGLRDWENKHWTLGSRIFLRTPLVNAAFDHWMSTMFDINMEPNKD
jgi:hypothetical protein